MPPGGARARGDGGGKCQRARPGCQARRDGSELWDCHGHRAPASEAAALPCAGGICGGARGKTPWLPLLPSGIDFNLRSFTIRKSVPLKRWVGGRFPVVAPTVSVITPPGGEHER